MIWLYGDYLFAEYSGLDSDHVFVNLLARPRGQAWTYAGVYDLALWLRRRTEVSFDPHWRRHAYAIGAVRAGVPIVVVSKLLGHSSITTTLAVYGHLTAEDAHAAPEAAGWDSGGLGGRFGLVSYVASAQVGLHLGQLWARSVTVVSRCIWRGSGTRLPCKRGRS